MSFRAGLARPFLIVAITVSRALHDWSADGTYHRAFPTSVPQTDELTRRGYTKVVRKTVGPDRTPTPSTKERFPDLLYMPPGPDNPLGTHAMYLGWPAYLIRAALRYPEDRPPFVGRLHRSFY